MESMNRSEIVMQFWEKHLLRLSVIGKFPDYLWLLELMERHDEWILIEALTMTPLEQGTGFARFDMILAVLSAKETKT